MLTSNLNKPASYTILELSILILELLIHDKMLRQVLSLYNAWVSSCGGLTKTNLQILLLNIFILLEQLLPLYKFFVSSVSETTINYINLQMLNSHSAILFILEDSFAELKL